MFFTSIAKFDECGEPKFYCNGRLGYIPAIEWANWWISIWSVTRNGLFFIIDSEKYLDIFHTKENETMADSAKKTVMEQLLELSASADEVKEGLTDVLTKEDLNKKVDAIASCYKKWQKLRTEIKKAERPDQTMVDANGKEVSSNFSKKAFEALKTLREKADKISRAVEKAITNDDYGDVFNIARDKGDGGQKGEEASDTGAA